jgi:hypothetical protein
MVVRKETKNLDNVKIEFIKRKNLTKKIYGLFYINKYTPNFVISSNNLNAKSQQNKMINIIIY